MGKRALLFGLNYDRTPARLRGCANDVIHMTEYLVKSAGFDASNVTSFVDTNAPHKCSKAGILNALMRLSTQTHAENLDLVYIHYSGHGGRVIDRSGDEKDGRDECLIPVDYRIAGVILDDDLQRIFAGFNPSTQIVVTFDCCHSATMADLTHLYDHQGSCKRSLDKVPAHPKIVTLSGCMDSQTSADAFNIRGKAKFSGALTSCLLDVLEKEPKVGVFQLLKKVSKLLSDKRFTQKPQIASSFSLSGKETLFEKSVKAISLPELNMTSEEVTSRTASVPPTPAPTPEPRVAVPELPSTLGSSPSLEFPPVPELPPTPDLSSTFVPKKKRSRKAKEPVTEIEESG